MLRTVTDTDRDPVYLIGSELMVRISTILELCSSVAQTVTVVISTVGAVLLWKPRALPVCPRPQIGESIATKIASAEMEFARVFH